MKIVAKEKPEFTIFRFGDSEIRVVNKNGDPWFVAKDVCDALKITNSRDALLKLDDDEKGVGLTDTLGGVQELGVVSESGMYTLVLRCRDAVNKGSVPHKFRKWVTAEVLPSIRKTGSYEKPLSRKSSTEERTPLRDAVNMLVSKKHIMYPEAYSMIHQRFDVSSIEQLNPQQIVQAIEYIHKVVLEGEFLGKNGEEGFDFPIYAATANAAYVLTEGLRDIFLLELEPALKMMGSPLSSRITTRLNEVVSLTLNVRGALTRASNVRLY